MEVLGFSSVPRETGLSTVYLCYIIGLAGLIPVAEKKKCLTR